MKVNEMKFPKNSSGILATLLSIVLFTFPFANYNSAQTEKEKLSRNIKVEYLGSVPLDSSLIELVPEEDKELIGLKERWLDSRMNLGGYSRLAVSENGKYKVIGTTPDQKSEGVVKATYIDSNGAEIWSADVGYVIYVSNNGRNITTASPLGDRVAFYDVRASAEPTSAADGLGTYTFSYNGEYFISAGSKLILRRANGSVIWEKDTGTPASKEVAISADGSHIVLTSSGEPELNITDSAEAEEEKHPEYNSPPKSVADERIDGLEPPKKQTVEKESKKPSQRARPDWNKKKVFLSFLKGDGTLINQTTILLRKAQNLAMSRDGKYVVLGCDSTVLFYETETSSLLWRKAFPSVYWWVKSTIVSQDGNIIALGIRPDRGDRYSPPHLYLLSKDGSEMGNFRLESPPSRESPPSLHYEWGPIVAFTEDEGHILVATYTTKFLFRIAEVIR
jgi:hypothetical protein